MSDEPPRGMAAATQPYQDHLDVMMGRFLLFRSAELGITVAEYLRRVVPMQHLPELFRDE